MGIEKIGRAQRGLLAFLDYTSQGIGPDELAQAVAVTMPGLPFLGESSFRAQTRELEHGGGSSDIGVEMRVPEGSLWVVREIGGYFRTTAAVAAAQQVSAGLRLSVLGFSPPELGDLGTGSANTFPTLSYWIFRQLQAINAGSTAGHTIEVQHSFNDPVILRPGCSILCGTQQITTALPVAGCFVGVWAGFHELEA